MKKITFKIVALMTAVIMTGALIAACGNKASTTSDAGQAQGIAGAYTAQVDFVDYMNNEFSDLGLNIDEEIFANFHLTLNADDSFQMSMDGDGLVDNVMAAFEKNGSDIVNAIFESQGLSTDLIGELAQISGYDSYDDMVDGMLDEVKDGLKTSLNEVSDSMHISGTYSVDGNKIALQPSAANSDNLEGTIENDGSITITSDIDGDNIELVFKK